MADVKWIKIATNIFDDEKIVILESMPDADSLIVIWFKLLTLAGKVNTSGVLMINERIAYTDEMLSAIFRRKPTVVKLALDMFEKLGMIELINNVVTIPNWNKHQQLDAIENRREYQKDYMRERREKQKQIAVGDCKPNGKPNSKPNVSTLESSISLVSSSNVIYFESLELNNAFIEFMKMRKTKIKNGGMTERAITMMINKLNQYDVSTAIEMLEQSTINNWKDIYELKGDKDNKPRSKQQLIDDEKNAQFMEIARERGYDVK